jgi:hypothetical protein
VVDVERDSMHKPKDIPEDLVRFPTREQWLVGQLRQRDERIQRLERKLAHTNPIFPDRADSASSETSTELRPTASAQPDRATHAITSTGYRSAGNEHQTGLVRTNKHRRPRPIATFEQFQAMLWGSYKPRAHHARPSESRLAIHALEMMSVEDVPDAWFGFLLARIGHNRAVSSATSALVTSSQLARGAIGVTLDQCHRMHGHALSALREQVNDERELDSDDTVLSIAALIPVESVIVEHNYPQLMHLDALVSILTKQSMHLPLSDVTRSVLDYHYTDVALVAVVRGEACPFEALVRQHYPEGYISSLNYERKLRALGNRLYTLLPRLIVLVRSIKDPSRSTKNTLLASKLANELLLLVCHTSENELLHNIKVTATLDSTIVQFSPYSIDFRRRLSYEAGVVYWQGRIFLLRTCLRLRGLSSTDLTARSLPATFEVKLELQKAVRNLLLSCQYGQSLRGRRDRRLFAHGMLLIWGALTDFPDLIALPPTREDILREWLSANTGRILLGAPSMNAADMESGAELHAGGQFGGMFVGLYQQLRRGKKPGQTQ